MGDDAAPTYFAVNTEKGDISIKRDIKSDTETDYQIRVRASDGGTPSLTAMALVHVHVNRNQFAPRFEKGDYKANILETQTLGVPFVKVVAKDQDTRVGMGLV